MLVYQLLRLLRQPIRVLNCLGLAFREQRWFVCDQHGQEQAFDRLRVVVDTRLFVLLRLERADKQRIVPVFVDQLDRDDWRMVKILEKMS